MKQSNPNNIYDLKPIRDEVTCLSIDLKGKKLDFSIQIKELQQQIDKFQMIVHQVTNNKSHKIQNATKVYGSVLTY